MISRLVNGVLGLSGGAAYLIVGVLAFAEAAAFTGLVAPGEVACCSAASSRPSRRSRCR
jgi:hypothetical protein